MRLDNWTRLSWWQRTRLAMVGTVAIAIVLAILIVTLIAALETSGGLAALSWLSFTAFPLIIVVMIASLARMQQRINIRAPQSRESSKDTIGARQS